MVVTRKKRTPSRLPWDVLTRLAGMEPWGFDYIMERRSRGIPPEGVRWSRG